MGAEPLSIELSDDQAVAAELLQSFIDDPWPTKPYVVLHGLAGTGKTTLLAATARRYPRIILVAFTGKAAAVLRRKFPGAEVSTLHSVLYHYRGSAPDESDPTVMNPIFQPKGMSLAHQVVMLDECSMISTALAEELLATGARVVAAGDPGQLPPVHGSQFFIEPSVSLTKIHRQAEGSAIIRQAHAIRSTGEYEADGETFRVISRANPEDLLSADILLCYRNRTRVRLNARKRALLGLAGPLKSGEPIMCLRNTHELGIFNGEIYQLMQDVSDDRTSINLVDDRGRVVFVPVATVEGSDPEYETNRYSEIFVPFAPAYASTVHKFQGSECPSVLLLDEADRDRTRYLYTGVTRASERATVLRWRDSCRSTT